MTRTLILMRHADAAYSGATDLVRPLSAVGRREASAAKAWFAAVGLRPDHALVSPALRTRETFELLGTGLEPQFDQAIYDGEVRDLLEAISTAPAACTTLLVVGHSPGIPTVAQHLPNAAQRDQAAWALVQRGFPTATAAVLELDTPDWALRLDMARLVAAHRVGHQG